MLHVLWCIADRSVRRVLKLKTKQGLFMVISVKRWSQRYVEVFDSVDIQCFLPFFCTYHIRSIDGMHNVFYLNVWIFSSPSVCPKNVNWAKLDLARSLIRLFICLAIIMTHQKDPQNSFLCEHFFKIYFKMLNYQIRIGKFKILIEFDLTYL